MFFSIETQQLIKYAIDGVVVVDDETTYNNMATAMSTLHSKLFIKSHKSYFTEDDLNILDEYRTKPIVGLCDKNLSAVGDTAPPAPLGNENRIEIDISRS